MATTHGPASGAGRFESWRAGWRVALRMARRDVRRHRGRSLLIVVMVGLPVLLLTAGGILWFTNDVDARERIPFQVGSAQAYLTDPRDHALQQMLDPSEEHFSADAPPGEAKPVPGYAEGREQEALEALAHADLVPVTSSPASAKVARHWVSVTVTGVDPAGQEALLAPRVALESGRWPRTRDEVVVTRAGIEQGLPPSGDFELRAESGERAAAPAAPLRTVSVVGVGSAYQPYGGDVMEPTDVIALPQPGQWDRHWLMVGQEAIPWAEVERLNEYGVGVFSRYAAEHPDTIPAQALNRDSRSELLVLVVGLSSLGLLLLSTLLAGPAFAVGASRQRRALALAASNGATRAQLRRTVLGQAVVLGVLSAVTGAGLGVALGVLGTVVLRETRPSSMFGPLEIPWPAVVLVAASAVASAVVAALVQARGLGRLDIVCVLRGQGVSPALRRRTPVVGAVLCAVGVGAVMIASFRTGEYYFYVFLGGSVLLVVGALLIVPLLLAVVARGGRMLPLPLRMAAREAGRQRGRAVPTVAAIMAGAAVLSTVCIALQGNTERAARSYQDQLAQGVGRIEWGMSTAGIPQLPSTLRRADPSVTTVVVQGFGRDEPGSTPVQLVAQRPGCTLEQTLPPDERTMMEELEASAGQPKPTGCETLSTAQAGPGGLLAADPAELALHLGLDDAQRRALESGAIAVVDPAEVRSLPVQVSDGPQSFRSVTDLRPVDVDDQDGRVTFAAYRQRFDADGLSTKPDPTTARLVTLPVVHLTHAQWGRLAVVNYGGYGGVMATATAQDLGLTPTPDYVLISSPDGISRATQAALEDALRMEIPDARVYVERGYERDDGLMLAILFGVVGLIILVATLIATALGQAEAQPLLGTLAAVGATRRTRRALAAAQATYLGLLGAVVGVLVGLVPGTAISRLITADYGDDGRADFTRAITTIPWLQVSLPIVLVPLVAGALAWVSIRRAPTVTRRAT